MNEASIIEGLWSLYGNKVGKELLLKAFFIA